MKPLLSAVSMIMALLWGIGSTVMFFVAFGMHWDLHVLVFWGINAIIAELQWQANERKGNLK